MQLLIPSSLQNGNTKIIMGGNPMKQNIPAFGKERFAQEQLQMMMKMADTRLNEFEDNVRSLGLSESNSRFQRHIRIEAGEPAAPNVDQAVDDFFEGSPAAEEKVRDGYKAIVKTALKDIHEDTTHGEVTDEKSFICAKSNKLVRVDAYAYRFNFPLASNAFAYSNVIAYLLVERIIDAASTSVQEIVSQVSECANANPEFCDAYINKMLETWEAYNNSAPGSPKKVAPRPGHLDDFSVTSPPDIGKAADNQIPA